MTLRSIFESLSKSLRFRKEIERSYPPEWAQVVGEYRDLGVELNTLKLRGIVQYLGVDKPKTRWRIDPEAPACKKHEQSCESDVAHTPNLRSCSGI